MTMLPKHVHRKGPSYYRVRGNVWVCLGRDLETALAKNDLIERTGCEDPGWWKHADILEHYKRVYRSCRTNARTRKIQFELSPEDFQVITDRASFRCEVSGIPFTLMKVGPTNKRPFAPSLDRIYSAMPYRLDNCRLVLWAVNAGMQDWGLETYLAIAEKAARFQDSLESPLESRRARRQALDKISRLKS